MRGGIEGRKNGEQTNTHTHMHTHNDDMLQRLYCERLHLQIYVIQIIRNIRGRCTPPTLESLKKSMENIQQVQIGKIVVLKAIVFGAAHDLRYLLCTRTSSMPPIRPARAPVTTRDDVGRRTGGLTELAACLCAGVHSVAEEDVKNGNGRVAGLSDRPACSRGPRYSQ